MTCRGSGATPLTLTAVRRCKEICCESSYAVLPARRRLRAVSLLRRRRFRCNASASRRDLRAETERWRDRRNLAQVEQGNMVALADVLRVRLAVLRRFRCELRHDRGSDDKHASDRLCFGRQHASGCRYRRERYGQRVGSLESLRCRPDPRGSAAAGVVVDLSGAHEHRLDHLLGGRDLQRLDRGRLAGVFDLRLSVGVSLVGRRQHGNRPVHRLHRLANRRLRRRPVRVRFNVQMRHPGAHGSEQLLPDLAAGTSSREPVLSRPSLRRRKRQGRVCRALPGDPVGVPIPGFRLRQPKLLVHEEPLGEDHRHQHRPHMLRADRGRRTIERDELSRRHLCVRHHRRPTAEPEILRRPDPGRRNGRVTGTERLPRLHRSRRRQRPRDLAVRRRRRRCRPAPGQSSSPPPGSPNSQQSSAYGQG